jgi:hypothetical protein
VLGLGVQGDASAASAYTATAEARLLAIDVTTSPPILFDPLFDGGVAVAQAQIDSLGGTSAFASDPYPGGTVIGLPGLLTSFAPGVPALPDFPLIVSSNQARPSAHVEAGPLVLDAQSVRDASSGRVTDGAASSQATTRADADSGRVHAHAETALPSLQLGPSLSLNGLRSAADVSKTPSGALERSATFEVASLSILGQRVVVTPTGLNILGTDVPLGIDTSSLLATLLGSLSHQGITIEFLPPIEVPNGVTSAGLRITTEQAPPPDLASGVESFRVQVTLGRASAFVTSDAFGPGDPDPGLALPDSSFVEPSGIGSDPGLALGDPSSPTIGNTRPDASRPENASYAIADLPLDRFYPALVVLAGLGIGIVNLIRYWGVRQT